MPVFTIEIDTDAKTCRKMVNGVEMDFDEMSLSQHSYKCDGSETIDYHVGIGRNIEDERMYHSYSWSESIGESSSDVLYSKVKASEKEIQQKKYYLFDLYKQEGDKKYKKDKDK